MEDYPLGSYLMFKNNPTVIGNRLICDIGYKYNYQKIIYFIVKEGVGSKNYGIIYLSNHPNKFVNISIWCVTCPQMMSKLFGFFKNTDPRNKSRKSDLSQEKF